MTRYPKTLGAAALSVPVALFALGLSTTATAAEKAPPPPPTPLNMEVDHSQHQMPAAMDHSKHQMAAPKDHSDHNMAAAKPMFTDHSGHAGAWMFEYQYMRMFMKDALDGSDPIDPKDILQNPLYTKDPGYGSGADLMTYTGYDMAMDMHMLMAMYNQSSRLTWMVMMNYLYNTMDMYDQMMPNDTPTSFPMDSQGIGDIQLYAIYTFSRSELFDVSFTFGLNLPTGSIDAPDGIEDMDTGEEGIAPYSMQLGSGTYDIHTALTLEKTRGAINYGAEVYRIARTGYNLADYNMGDSLRIKSWARYRFSFGTQIRTGITQNVWSKVEGRDVRMSDNTNYTGGKRLDVSLGLGQSWRDFGIYADYALPVSQYLNGVQMKTTGILTVGLQYMMM